MKFPQRRQRTQQLEEKLPEPKQRMVLPRLPLPMRVIRCDDLLSDQVVAFISDSIGEGLPIKVTAAALGIHRKTLQRWLQRGEVDWGNGVDSRFAALVIEIARGRYEHIRNSLENLREVPPGSWQRYAWLLERTESDSFALRKDRETVKDAAAVISELFAKRDVERQALPGGDVIEGEVDSES